MKEYKGENWLIEQNVLAKVKNRAAIIISLIGTMFYMIVMFSIHNGVKSGDKWKVCISLILILDILQGMFNNFQPACMPINFIYIGLLNSRMCKVTSRKI